VNPIHFCPTPGNPFGLEYNLLHWVMLLQVMNSIAQKMRFRAFRPRAQAVVCSLVWTLAIGSAAAQEVVSVGGKEAPEVRFITLAPSTYTHRFDCVRAGLGIALQLQRLSEEHQLPVRIGFRNGVPALRSEAEARALLRGAPVLVLGGSTWSQGSAAPLRRFFEVTGSESLWGASASVWATSGGSHTGGEMVVQDSLRSLMGMGAQVFTLGQKLMVFTTDERVGVPAGEFTLLDCWYMEQYAKVLLMTAHSKGSPEKAREVAQQLKLTHAYYFGHPKTDEELRDRHQEFRGWINTASLPKTNSLPQITQRLRLGPDNLRPALPGIPE
jgi:hypothetical protein